MSNPKEFPGISSGEAEEKNKFLALELEDQLREILESIGLLLSQISDINNRTTTSYEHPKIDYEVYTEILAISLAIGLILGDQETLETLRDLISDEEIIRYSDSLSEIQPLLLKEGTNLWELKRTADVLDLTNTAPLIQYFSSFFPIDLDEMRQILNADND